MSTVRIPAYRDLPVFGEDLPVRHAREFWGPRSRLGTLAWIDAATRLEAMQTPREGRAINLSLPLDQPSPPMFGRPPLSHTVFERDRNIVEDRIEMLDLQGSSQWDGLRHVRARHYGPFNADALADEAELGIETWVTHGLVFRAVLADIGAHWAASGAGRDPVACEPIDVAELDACLTRQGADLRTGDLLLVRTGWLAAVRSGDRYAGDVGSSAGLAATEEMAEFLWDQHVSAVATDNPAVECVPRDPGGGFLHRLLIPALGMPLGELWLLDELATHCSNTGRFECCVVSVPIHVPGAAGSPCNALAIV